MFAASIRPKPFESIEINRSLRARTLRRTKQARIFLSAGRPVIYTRPPHFQSSGLVVFGVGGRDRLQRAPNQPETCMGDIWRSRDTRSMWLWSGWGCGRAAPFWSPVRTPRLAVATRRNNPQLIPAAARQLAKHTSSTHGALHESCPLHHSDARATDDRDDLVAG